MVAHEARRSLTVSERKRTYRQFSPEQKTEIVLAGIRMDRSVRDVCREHEISVFGNLNQLLKREVVFLQARLPEEDRLVRHNTVPLQQSEIPLHSPCARRSTRDSCSVRGCSVRGT